REEPGGAAEFEDPVGEQQMPGPGQGRAEHAEPQREGPGVLRVHRGAEAAFGHRHGHQWGEKYSEVRMNSHTRSTKCQYSAMFATAWWLSRVHRPRKEFTSSHAISSRPTATCRPWNPVMVKNSDP